MLLAALPGLLALALSLSRVVQLRQIPAGLLSLMPTGRSQSLWMLRFFHVCLSMRMSYCLENFICTQPKKNPIPIAQPALVGKLASFHLQSSALLQCV